MFNNIGEFLRKRIGPAFARQNLYKEISNIIKSETNIDLLEDSINIKNKILFIKTNPIRKQQILLQSNKILLKIKEVDSSIEIQDIR